MKLLEHALDAANRGLKVFPCQPRLKTPATAHGSKEMTSDEAQIRKWWSQMPEANIGCNAGVIVDIDDGVDSLAQVQNVARIWGLPITLSVRTGRRPGYGAQLHFTGTAPSQGPFEANGCSGEIRTLAGNYYGMAPGSIHPSGNTYEIVVDVPIAVYPPNSRLAPLQHGDKDYGPMTVETIRSKMTWWMRQIAQASEGTRNDTAHKATYFAARGFLAGAFEESETEIKDAIFQVVSPLYLPPNTPRPGGVRAMLDGSWKRGSSFGPFELCVREEEWFVDKDGHMQRGATK